jgi:hypothetical protein
VVTLVTAFSACFPPPTRQTDHRALLRSILLNADQCDFMANIRKGQLYPR